MFIKVFKIYFLAEESSEILRKKLEKRPNFNVHDAFTACDSDKNGYITRDELKGLLNEYSFYPTDIEL